MYTYLIVDDEMIERKGIRMLLSWMNIRENILEASNGEEALEVFEKEKIDVLLTDINMPFMDGIELLSRIHEEYPGTETVIFSGYDEFSYAKKAISYGVSAYILKPVNPEEFKKVVGEITEKLAKSEREEKRKDESMEFLREHLLYLMVNGQSRSAMQEKTQTLLDMSFVRDFCRMVLLECANNYFEQVNSEQIENCASHSRYFSDELDAQNFYQKEEQMFDIFLCIWYTIFMNEEYWRKGERKLTSKIYKIGSLQQYKYVVVLSEYKGKILLSRHKNRTTWETQGGHIELGEEPLEAAKRELYEESGAIDYEIEPLCDYWAGVEGTDDWANGMVFYAKIYTLGQMPESEMIETKQFDELPQNLTYPEITPVLFQYLFEK